MSQHCSINDDLCSHAGIQDSRYESICNCMWQASSAEFKYNPCGEAETAFPAGSSENAIKDLALSLVFKSAQQSAPRSFSLVLHPPSGSAPQARIESEEPIPPGRKAQEPSADSGTPLEPQVGRQVKAPIIPGSTCTQGTVYCC